MNKFKWDDAVWINNRQRTVRCREGSIDYVNRVAVVILNCNFEKWHTITETSSIIVVTKTACWIFIHVKRRSQTAVLASTCCLLAKTWAKFGDPHGVSTASVRIWEHADRTKHFHAWGTFAAFGPRIHTIAYDARAFYLYIRRTHVDGTE